MIQSISTVFNEKEITSADALKMAAGMIFGIAADAAVSAALGGLMPAGRGWKHLLRLGGTFILAMMAGERAEEYVCRMIDDFRKMMKNEETKEESKE